MRQILTGGENRSGTTLLSLILNSHPDLCVGPDLDFVEPVNLGTHTLEAIALVAARDPSAVGPGTASGDPFWYDAAHFVKQCERFGATYTELAELIERHRKRSRGNLVGLRDRCALITELGESRAHATDASAWGIKLQRKIKDVDLYADIWPEARFIHIIRDGRDVLASHLHTVPDWGHKNIEVAARDWSEIIAFARHRAPTDRYIEVRYEDLVTTPEAVTKNMCDFLEITWAPAMTRHHELDHPLHHKPWSHPAAEQTKQPLTTNAIGRYRNELDPDTIAAYEGIAGEVLASCGYETEPRLG